MGKVLISLVKVVYELVEVFVISASVFVVIYLFLMQPHQVKGNSMLPNFHNGEYLLTDKVSYRRHTPARGDVIVFRAPVDENLDFIKRVIAVGGDKIMIKQNDVYLNGQVLDESLYLSSGDTTHPGQFLKEGQEYQVPDGTVFAMGDNRTHSSDSREWGPVPNQNIIGRAFFRYWPPQDLGAVKNPVN